MYFLNLILLFIIFKRIVASVNRYFIFLFDYLFLNKLPHYLNQYPKKNSSKELT